MEHIDARPWWPWDAVWPCWHGGAEIHGISIGFWDYWSHGPVEIVDLPIKNCDFPSFFVCLPLWNCLKLLETAKRWIRRSLLIHEFIVRRWHIEGICFLVAIDDLFGGIVSPCANQISSQLNPLLDVPCPSLSPKTTSLDLPLVISTVKNL
jgi:hypothetical protein